MTDHSILYVPIVKAREAEIKALLRSPRALQVMPLFELQLAPPPSVDKQTGLPARAKGVATDAAYFLDDIARLWDTPLFVDISRVAKPSDRHAWWNLLDSLTTIRPPTSAILPVVFPSDTEATFKAAAPLAHRCNGMALRVPMTADVTPSSVLAGLTQLASATRFDSNGIDVVLDWSNTLEQSSLDALQAQAHAIIAAITGDCHQIITAGTPNTDLCLQSGDWELTRREWWLWLRLVNGGDEVSFGDYALHTPSDPVPARPPYGHLRYSSGDNLHVHRRAKPGSAGQLADAFHECCLHLVGESHWLGPAYSRADARIDDIANLHDKESTPLGWRQIAAEHHFTLVQKQLAAPSPPPPAGTL